MILTRGLQRTLLALALLVAPLAGWAQDTPDPAPEAGRQVDESGALMPRPGAPALVEAQVGVGPVNGLAATDQQAGDAPVELDYGAWEDLAARAEEATGDRTRSSVALEHLRAQLADWRVALQGAQSANATRIATLRDQIAALGPVPTEGLVEADEIAQRRSALTDQLVRLQAPGLAAEEAYRRADGLIREIDRVLRERQTDELLKLWPVPVNPANWPAGLIALSDTAVTIWFESRSRLARAEARATFVDNLPLIVLYLALAVALIWRGREFVERLTQRLQDAASARGRNVWALLVSLGQIVIPTIGMVLLARALVQTGFLGVLGEVLVDSLPACGFAIFVARWLGSRLFPRGETAAALTLSAERRAEGRFLSASFGVLVALETLRRTLMDQIAASETATAVLIYPVLVLAGLLLVRLGQLLRRHVANAAASDSGVKYSDRILAFLARGAMVAGVVGPILATVGYVSAAAALVFPAILSLALLGLLFILQRLVGDIYALIIRDEESGQDGLVPVLIGFGLTLASLPLYALIWGARAADITEIWTRFREGYQLGETRISPTDFLYFAIIFAFGFMLTRLFQGALRSSILPRTKLDQGGQNAIVSGVGYVGVFLAGLIAINSAGIDLSGLAIVAGALSVGIGFGLQNIVSNFVSGIILLIERPVSEGDWIDVGGTQGIVKSISVRSTRIQTFDRSDVIVPNSDLISGRVTNWTRFNLSGRLIVPVGVAYGSDTRKVERVLREIAEAQPLAILNPPPTVVFASFGADALNFEIRVILRDVNFSLSVRNEINHQIAERFAVEGIEMPFAQRDLWLRNADEVAAAFSARPVPQAARPSVDHSGPPEPDLPPAPEAST